MQFFLLVKDLLAGVKKSSPKEICKDVSPKGICSDNHIERVVSVSSILFVSKSFPNKQDSSFVSRSRSRSQRGSRLLISLLGGDYGFGFCSRLCRSCLLSLAPGLQLMIDFPPILDLRLLRTFERCCHRLLTSPLLSSSSSLLPRKPK